MKAVVMAGGQGTRLRPLTSNQPKPMLPLVNRPMMEHTVSLLRQCGFDEIVVTVAFLANQVRNYFGDGSEFGVRMVYATEDSPLGTAGSVANARKELDDTFIVISGDALTDIDLGAVVDEHRRKGAMATIGLSRVEDPLEFGIVITKEDGSVERFLEKPSWGQVFSDTVNNGIFVLEPEIFDYIETGRSIDFSSEVFPLLLEKGRPLYGHVCEGYWEDVGTPEAYVRTHWDALDGKVRLNVPGFRLQGGIWLGAGAEIDPDATVEGPALVGDNSRVEAGARLGPYTVLGSNVRVGADADLERSVVHNGVHMGRGVWSRGAVIGRGCDLRSGARCDDGVVLGDQCSVGEGAVLAASVKVYPFKTVEPGAVVNSSLVWESRGARSLFGRHGVAGLANIDMTPELATRVAMAYATTLDKGSTVTISRDSSRTARMLKRAVMAGINSAGVHIDDLEVAPVPVTRFHVRSQRSQGGITVRLVGGDAQSVIIRFFDHHGLDLSESEARKVERLFHREDYRRVFPGDIGDIAFAPRATEYYSAALIQDIDIAAVRKAKFKVVVDYSFGTTSFVMPNVLSKLGAEVLAVNPFASTKGAMSFDKGARTEQMAGLVRSSGAHLGAVIDSDGEHVSFLDDRGRALSDMESLLAFVQLVAENGGQGCRIAVPVSATSVAQRLAEERGAEVLWTKLSSAELVSASVAEQVTFAGTLDGGFVFPAFLPAQDAMAALLKMLELLAVTSTSLSEIVAALPSVYVVHETVDTSAESKGMVMRSLVEQVSGSAEPDLIILVDGVKVLHEGGWALVVPDPEDPLTHVWAEGEDEAGARRLAHDYAGRIQSAQR